MGPADAPQQPVLEWCRLAAAGDATALQALIEVHHPRFLGLVRRKLGTDWQGKLEPEDVLQEAYVDVFAGISTLRDVDAEAFYRWVTRIIEHKLIDHIRHWRTQKRDLTRERAAAAGGAASGSTYDLLLADVQAASPTPSRLLKREEALAALLACIAQLPEEQRVAVTRAYLRGEPYAAIAKDLDRTEEAVRKLVSRGIARLHECMGRASMYLSQR